MSIYALQGGGSVGAVSVGISLEWLLVAAVVLVFVVIVVKMMAAGGN